VQLEVLVQAALVVGVLLWVVVGVGVARVPELTEGNGGQEHLVLPVREMVEESRMATITPPPKRLAEARFVRWKDSVVARMQLVVVLVLVPALPSPPPYPNTASSNIHSNIPSFRSTSIFLSPGNALLLFLQSHQPAQRLRSGFSNPLVCPFERTK
jgi:hypothetical protein